ncbi:MAG: glycerol-3-phosphate 1-O-acyltransferase PlsY, partial [candidate division KSB1 bacterium]|nr:glycerol-3-phosphate 1-O-acyltransferase PlsY [candidate division KSB1 bacterium]
MLRILFAAVLSYLMGGFPTAIVVGKLFRGIDIRQYGSGNAGATNAFRVLGWKLALPVVLIDVFKGVAAVLFVAPLALPSAVLPAEAVRLICGVAAVAGHVWTPYAGFRGGKGVGTGFGAMIAIAPLPTAMASIVWIWVVLLTGYVSLASMLGAASVP